MLHWFLCWATEALPSQDLLRSRRQTPQSLFFCERKDQIPSAVSQNMPAREGISAHIHSMMLHPRSKPKMTDISCCQVTPLKTHCCSSAQEKKKSEPNDYEAGDKRCPMFFSTWWDTPGGIAWVFLPHLTPLFVAIITPFP